MLNDIFKRKRPLFLLLLLTFALTGLFAWQRCAAREVADPSEAIQYIVIKDDMSSRMRIGISANAGEPQVRATLAKAADDHQNDPARDLIFGPYFFVGAYLVDGEKQSVLVAGTLRRYAAPLDRDYEDDDWRDYLLHLLIGKSDTFSITVEKARQSFK